MKSNNSFRVILLGTAGGAGTWVPQKQGETTRFGISTALVIHNKIYIVDTGYGSVRQLTLANPLRAKNENILASLQAIFFTHLHSDHTADFANYLHASRNQGWPAKPVHVFGPGPIQIDEENINSHSKSIMVPGTKYFVSHICQSFLADTIDRTNRSSSLPLEDLVRTKDILLPNAQDGIATAIYEDSSVMVSTILVDHGSMKPALAYRFDTEYGSVVISGDTAPCTNIVTIARQADILIHEAISWRFDELTYGTPPFTAAQRRAIEHVFEKHTSSKVVGLIAQRAGVKKLVLSHLVPANAPQSDWTASSGLFGGEFIVGHDLMTISL